MTVEEELTQLEEQVRRLKIEFEVYFNGGRDRPPTDLQWRVEAQVKKYNENTKLSYAQRFRFNTIAQRYQIHNDMWRQKLKAKEEGREPRRREAAAAQAPGSFRVQWHD